MPRIIHPLAGMIALLTIATFWLSTAISELFLSESAVVAVKTAIPWGFLLLVPALAATGGSGFFLSHGQRRGLVGAKLKRMPFIAANGLLILIPAALFLASKARAGDFDTTFYVVQGIELLAGATNIALLGLGMRDGMKLTQWKRGNFLRPAPSHKTTLAGKAEVARDTSAFRLQKPEGFSFRAGQAVYVTLPGQKETDSKGGIRTFSIASAPQEPDLVIATRMTDTAFKRCLAELPAGSPVAIEGPYGDLTLDGDTRPAVFLAGGIGITPFDLFGRARQTADAARLSAAAEEAAFTGAFTSLSAEVADTYVQYRACRMMEAIYRQALASQAETLKATDELASVGLSPDSDPALARANAASAAISLETQQADCRVIAQSLAVAVGVSQDRIDAILAGGGGLPAARAFRISEIPAEALRQRPDVIEAELAFASAMKTMGAAQAGLFPALSLGGTITLTNPKSWSFGPALSLPIFDGGARQASLRSANADAITAGETWRKTVLSAVAEIEGALTRLNAARRSGAKAREAVSGYRTYFDAVDDNWKAGGETLLNREEARRSLQTAQITEVQQREAELRQWIAPYKAAGGGWTGQKVGPKAGG